MQDLFQFAADLSRTAVLTYSPDTDPSSIAIESLTISADAMPRHHVCRAVIYDLQPTQMVRAIAAVEARLREQFSYVHRTGWRAASDGIYLHFIASKGC
jgi:hypothetical protein